MKHRNSHLRSGLAALICSFAAACAAPTGTEPRGHGTPDALLDQGPTAQGTTYYISPTGKNSRNGQSPAQAWRTIDKVNFRNFVAGDRILFEGGATFSGQIQFTSSDAGNAASPIVIGSYGTGRATINAGNGTGLSIYNTSGFEVRNLNFIGSGRTTNTGSGVSVYTDLAGSASLPWIRIDSVDAGGFGYYGVSVGSWNGTSGFRDVRVTASTAHDNGRAGFITYAQLPSAHRSVYMGQLRAWQNTGVSGLSTNTGSGIAMGGVSGGTIERSSAWDNGALNTALEGPVGIWTWDSDGVVIQYNESYRNKTGGSLDGGGFDLDQNVRNSVLQYNYSHENHGPGFLLAHSISTGTHSGNIVRYNISENDGRKSSQAAIVVYGRIRSAEIHNNTIFVTQPTSGTSMPVRVHNDGVTSLDVSNVHLRNNMFFASGPLTLVDVSAGQVSGAVDLRFEGNRYFTLDGAFSIKWAGTNYTTLASWRSATAQERLAGADVGSSGAPSLNTPGSGGTIGNTNMLHTMT
ncbi:MAG: right-handed parallel beta-helix repeat-containing protein, partial [Gemmatimonadota bacterium]